MICNPYVILISRRINGRRMAEIRNAYTILTEHLEKCHLRDLGVYGQISEWILDKLGRRMWTGLFWLKIRTTDVLSNKEI
jgi:hypothetical protein